MKRKLPSRLSQIEYVIIQVALIIWTVSFMLGALGDLFNLLHLQRITYLVSGVIYAYLGKLTLKLFNIIKEMYHEQ